MRSTRRFSMVSSFAVMVIGALVAAGPGYAKTINIKAEIVIASVTFEVRAGSHWFPIGSASFPGTCGSYQYDSYVKSHFKIGSATATVPDNYRPKPKKRKPAPKPTTCPKPILGPVVGTKGEPLEIERRGGGPPIYVKAGSRKPHKVLSNAAVGGRFRLTTGPGEWATVGPWRGPDAS